MFFKAPCETIELQIVGVTERHDFRKETIQQLCDRVGSLCSNPECRVATKGPHSEDAKATNIGTASHIHAASPGGPRYDSGQTEADRRAIHNGLWLCRNCGTLIDRDPERFPAPLLREWRASAELHAFLSLGKPSAAASAPSDGIPFSAAAATEMQVLGTEYARNEFPNIEVWGFTPSAGNILAFNELKALRLVKFGGPRGGPWYLTEKGLEWIMYNRTR